MISQELQIMEGRTGDYWGQITTAMDIRAYPPEYIMTPLANESQSFIKMGEGESIEGYCLRKEDHLSPHGQWTTVDLVCFEERVCTSSMVTSSWCCETPDAEKAKEWFR